MFFQRTAPPRADGPSRRFWRTAAFFGRGGMLLEQHKDPALSRDLRDCTSGAAEAMDLPPADDPGSLSGEEVLRYARSAAIIDERDGLLLADKLEQGAKGGVSLLVADAVDDEPYVSSQLSPLFKLSQQAVEGLWLAARAAGTSESIIAVYKNLYDTRLKIPGSLYGVRIRKITGKYPAEARTLFTQQPQSTLLVGVCALIHLYRAVHRGVRQTSAFVTVAGDCVANPQNLEVLCGVTTRQVLERCGLIEIPGRVVLGGPMTGRCISPDEEVPVTPTTRAVLAFRSNERDRHYQCIGCGKCVKVCPQGLSPVYLYKGAQTKNLRLLRLCDAVFCTGCGTCSYVCPAKLDLSAEIRRAAGIVRSLDSAKEEEASHD